jgi:hypothetical protein
VPQRVSVLGPAFIWSPIHGLWLLASGDTIEPSSRGLKKTPSPYKNRKAYLLADEGLANTLHRSRPNSWGQLLLPLRVMPSTRPQQQMHGWSIPSKCAVVETTMIREGHEFEDLNYPNEEEGIEKQKDAKGNFIICPRKI